nr:MAG TPA: hypothetical protein [Caudoviricetes sp.]
MMMETINLNKMIDVYSNYTTDGGVFSPMVSAPWVDTMSGTNLDILYLDGHSGERYCSNFINHRINDSDVLSSDNRTLISNILWAMFGIQWTRLWATMKPAEYDPLTNYQMQETMEGTENSTRTPDLTKGDTGTVQTTGQDKRTPNLTRNGTGTVNDNGSATNTNQNGIWGFNSSTSVPSDMSDGTATNENTTTRDLTETETGTDTTDHTNTDTYNRSYTETGTDTTAGTSSRKLTRTGNIGTNTFQNLLQQERNIWMYDFFEQVFKDVDSVLTIPIY